MKQKFLGLLFELCFCFSCTFAQNGFNSLPISNRIPIDTIHISGYVVTLGKTKYYGKWDSGNFIPTDSGYYSSSYFVPIDTFNRNPIGGFLEKYITFSDKRDNNSLQLDNIFLFCVENNPTHCDYFSHSKTQYLNKYFKSVLPKLVSPITYHRINNEGEVRIFYLDGIWLKFSLPKKYNYNVGLATWPIVPDTKKDFCTYYILIDYYAFSSSVSLKDTFLTLIK